MEFIEDKEFKSLLKNKTPFIDVRSEIEYGKGSIPGSVNLPLLNTHEREMVGKCYKEEGQEKAVKLGHELVCDRKREERVKGWKEFAENNPGTIIYCARGGLRSQITQRWLYENGVEIPYIKGGFKSLRNFLLKSIGESVERNSFLVLAGPTGSGKTIFLNEYKDIIDLEKRANHRGSSFGKYLSEQPAQIDFENRVAMDFILLGEKKVNKILIEDESRLIGRVHLPDSLSVKMGQSDIAVLDTPMEERVESILKEYVVESLSLYNESEENGFDAFSKDLLFNLKRILKKLGGLRYKEIKSDMNEAFDQHKNKGETDYHRVWIEKLLKYYYDPMYGYSLKKRADQIVFRGNFEEIREFLSSNSVILS